MSNLLWQAKADTDERCPLSVEAVGDNTLTAVDDGIVIDNDKKVTVDNDKHLEIVDKDGNSVSKDVGGYVIGAAALLLFSVVAVILVKRKKRG